jgi:hypothetical protein
VIGKVCPRGSRVAGLLYYLHGPGRHEEHTDPHLIAGWRHPAELEPSLREDGHRDFRQLNGLLQQPHDALGERGFDRSVWHCSVRAAPGDRMLSDDEWAQVACEIMHRTGLAPYGQEDEAVRWVAVRHAPDHIHIVAMLARQDGTRPRLWNDYYRVGEACRAAEDRLGLRATAPRDRTATRPPTRAESEKAHRRGLDEPPRVTLRHAVATAAATASSEQEFFAHLDTGGISVRKRFSTRNPGEITGYAVALPADTTATGGPVWYSGGKLAPDLTLPKLRHRWAPAATASDTTRFAKAERNAIYDHAARTARDAAQHIHYFAATDPSVAADAAWATADTLHAAASALGNKELRRAAASYDRAARLPHGRVPRPTPVGNSLRGAARVLSVAATAAGDQLIVPLRLILHLAVLAEAVMEVRIAQRRAAQANAARIAVERLRMARRMYTAPPASQARARAPCDRARRDFPLSIQQVLAERSANASTSNPAAASRPSPGSARRRQRGPTR